MSFDPLEQCLFYSGFGHHLALHRGHHASHSARISVQGVSERLESVKELAGAHGVFNMSVTDHLGLDQRARVMVKIENGAWKYQP